MFILLHNLMNTGSSVMLDKPLAFRMQMKTTQSGISYMIATVDDLAEVKQLEYMILYTI